jgi:DNA-binding MarR family transcriptional regulator
MGETGVAMTDEQRAVLAAAWKLNEAFTVVGLATQSRIAVSQINKALGVLSLKALVRAVPAPPEGGARTYVVTDLGRAEMERWEKYGRCERELQFRASLIRRTRMAVPFPGSRGARR